jgi:outer membrane protein assembly factor BamB
MKRNDQASRWFANPVNPLCAFVCLGCFVVHLEAADWPQFLGPHANGISDETNLLNHWPAAGPPLAWEKKIGTGYSAPSVRDSRLVLHHRIGGEEVVEAFEADTGKPLWRQAHPSSFVDPYGYNNGPRCTPLLTTNRCYTFGAEGKLLCLKLATGEKVWERDTAKDWNVPEAFFGVGSTPILEGNLLIVMVGGQPNSGVVALDAETGKTVWESVGASNWQGQRMIGWPGEPLVKWMSHWKQASYATPVAATMHGKRHLFCLMRQGLVSLEPKTGEVNFSRWFCSTVNESVNAANPVVVDDQVFFSAAYYRVGSALLRVQPDGRSFEEVWRSPREPREKDPRTGGLVSPVLEIHWSTPIHHAGYLYALSGRNEPDARFRCVEFKTGRLMWDRDESWRPHSTPPPKVFGRGSLILADGKLIVLGEGGLLGLFKVNSQKLEEISRHQVPQLRYPCWAGPVVANKRLYLRSEDRLVCLNLAE